MDRRNFISVIGAGSSALAAPGLLGGCAGALRSTEAWNLEPDRRDIRRLVLSYAILAPNPHNKQPWLIKLTGPRSFELFVDQTRLLPQTDPPARQIHIGQGTFLEHAEIAARAFGHRAELQYFPQGMYANDVVADKPVASVELIEDGTATKDPLFDQILKRQTNRRDYDGEALSESQIAKLAGSAGETTLTFSSEPHTRGRLTELLAEGMRIEVADGTRHEETVAMFRFSDKEMEEHRDGFGLAQSGTTGISKWFVETFVISRETAVPADSAFATAAVDMTAAQASSAPTFGWMSTAANTRLDQVKVGRAYARLCLTATSLGIAQHPMSQVLQEYADMSKLQKELLEVLGISAGAKLQILFRLGRAKPVARSPRRRLEEMIA